MAPCRQSHPSRAAAMPPEHRETWVTGVAAVTALADDLDNTWSALRAGRTAGRTVELRTPAGQVVRVPAAPVDSPLLAGVRLEASSVRADRLALHVARRAACDASLSEQERTAAAVVFGSSKPSLGPWFAQAALEREDPTECHPEDVADLRDYRTSQAWDMLAPQRTAVRIARDLACGGPILSAISACGTGLHSLIRAVQWLADGGGSIAIAGAVESSLNPLFAASFLRMRVLATTGPARAACRPFDLHRGGFVIGEGAAAFVLETPQHARSRGARPLAVIAGYACGADPTGLADMDPAGRPMAAVIRRCLAATRIDRGCVGAIKAHGTATPQNDAAESAAIRTVFETSCPPVVSLKGHLGHCLGASGAIETAIGCRAIAAGVLPATANLATPDPACDIRHARVSQRAFGDDSPYLLCLSAGFGGHLGALVLGKPRHPA